jgi:DNA-binding transcriptional regulator WhiA
VNGYAEVTQVEDHVNRVAGLYGGGLTLAEVAAETGRSPSGVRSTLERAGIPRRSRGGTNPARAANLVKANEQRIVAAAARDVAVALAVLDKFRGSFWPYPPAWRRVAEARTALPEASWAELGDLLCMTKDQAASDFRRLRRAMGAGG